MAGRLLKIEFRISSSLTGKPQAEEELKLPTSNNENGVQRPECFGPGSDIANCHPDILIDTVNNTHLLVINKFCVFRPQLLMLSSDSYRRQSEPLSQEDFEAAWTTLSAMEFPNYMLYNCNSLAGASRHHKHMQIIPMPEDPDENPTGFKFFPDRTGFDFRKIPFRYSLKYLVDLPLELRECGSVLLRVYKELLAQNRKSLDVGAGGIFPHNVVTTKEWMIVIPRSSNNFHGITANGAGMMGSVWLSNTAQLEEGWIKYSFANALSHLGVGIPPKDEKEM
ncbi:MAG: hypothetical protein M1834_003695 [Cirrosporium novae-zelandiae]|nr:MAG: hypothetical protein M1834_003695 [Cirrosporium novae-zelandiae]